MARLNGEDRQTALLKKKAQIEAQLKKLDARQKQTARKADTRRKVIAGAVALEHLQRNPGSEFGKVLFALLDKYADPRARHLFPFLPQRDGQEVRPSGERPVD